MHSLQKQFHDFIEEEELLEESDCVLLAVSGGLDSIVMAELFKDSNWKFGIAHCNFNLRGEESDGDEVFVIDWAEREGIEIHVKNFDLGNGSTQLNARNARYRWFRELASEKSYSKVATAHHLNDSLETVLINLSRGTGLKGLAGIKPKSDMIIRPLMFAAKTELRNYAEEFSLEWREDSSNEKTDYDRNLLRKEVLPVLEQLNPSLIDTFRNTFERTALANQLVQRQVNEIKKDNLTYGATIELKLGWILAKSDLLVLSEILAEFGFNYATTKEIFMAIGKPGKQFLVDDKILSMDRDSLFIKTDKESTGQILIEGSGNFDFQGKEFSVAEIEKDKVDFTQGSDVAYLDATLLDFPLKIRKWGEGDRFKPLGMSGTKKVSDYLIDEKVPVAKKGDVVVLLSGDQIVWLVGFRLSDQFKITKSTKRVLMISVNQSE